MAEVCMKSLQTAILLDFYGNLLTDKMRRYMEMYYYDDLSLAEIAESENISRQGVYDSLKRADNTLMEFESKLGLAKRFKDQTDKTGRALAELDKGNISKAKEILTDLLENMTEEE